MHYLRPLHAIALKRRHNFVLHLQWLPMKSTTCPNASSRHDVSVFAPNRNRNTTCKIGERTTNLLCADPTLLDAKNAEWLKKIETWFKDLQWSGIVSTHVFSAASSSDNIAPEVSEVHLCGLLAASYVPISADMVWSLDLLCYAVRLRICPTIWESGSSIEWKQASRPAAWRLVPGRG